jgi:pyrroline-5-carboxylate reductase
MKRSISIDITDSTKRTTKRASYWLLLRPPVTPNKATDLCNASKDEDSEEGSVSISCAPSVVIKELQQLLGAFMAGNMVYRKKSKQGNDRESHCHDLYHGAGGAEDTVLWWTR